MFRSGDFMPGIFLWTPDLYATFSNLHIAASDIKPLGVARSFDGIRMAYCMTMEGSRSGNWRYDLIA
jgi:hypothetical protein